MDYMRLKSSVAQCVKGFASENLIVKYQTMMFLEGALTKIQLLIRLSKNNRSVTFFERSLLTQNGHKPPQPSLRPLPSLFIIPFSLIILYCKIFTVMECYAMDMEVEVCIKLLIIQLRGTDSLFQVLRLANANGLTKTQTT